MWSDDVFDAAVRRAGALRVQDFTEFFSTAAVLDAGVRTRGSRLAVVTNAGGPGVMAADHCADALEVRRGDAVGVQGHELFGRELVTRDRAESRDLVHLETVAVLKSSPQP